MDRLKQILTTMDVPKMRIGANETYWHAADLRWLARNLGIRNSLHPQFQEAMSLIKESLR